MLSMKVLLLGLGLQGRAVAHDLEQSTLVQEVVGADLRPEAASAYLQRAGLEKISVTRLDAGQPGDLERLVRSSGARIVISMLPPALAVPAARSALTAGVPYVSSNYTRDLGSLDAEARRRGVAVLPEMGMDPGIDLLLCALAIADLDQVHGLRSYGAGLPELACADNPLRYKVTWSFEGVLAAYTRPARFLYAKEVTDLPGAQIFREENVEVLELPGVGLVEAYANGDAIRYIELFGLDADGPLREMKRLAFRWPGHCHLWRPLVDLGLLDDEPVPLGEASISPRLFLARLLEPRLQFGPDERDIAVLVARARGTRDGTEREVTYALVDHRDLDTGLFAMNRTVGFTASIAAQMILSGEIDRTGVLSPARDVPARRVLAELEKRGMELVHREASPDE
jgi:saccharopine dehydrogenase-like NADP-dependent oxidoreductase